MTDLPLPMRQPSSRVTRRGLAHAALALAAALLLAGCAPLRTAPPGTDTQAPPIDGGGYAVTVCDARYAGRAAQCTLSGGTAAGWRLRANLISGDTLYVGGLLIVDGEGRISHAGCPITGGSSGGTPLLDCPGALASAGLINLHEHIDYSYQQPARPPSQSWTHRNEWRGLTAEQRGFEGDAPKDATVRTEVSLRAMLRHAMNGETAVSGAKDYRAYLRNLKLPEPPLAMPWGAPVMDSTFPLGDAVSRAILSAPCTATQVAAVKFAPDQPFVPHVGEGTGDGARWEVDCVLEAVRAKPTPSAFIHGTAIDASQARRLAEQQVAVVLSPRSNFQLYGRMAPVAALRQSGVTLALGTDWSPSGSLALLDEARCLARHDRDALGSQLSAAELHRMLTRGPARAVGLQGQVGALAAGEWADLVLWDTEGRSTLAEVLAHTALAQTLGVWVGGRIASAPPAWAARLPQLAGCAPDPRQLCGQERMVCGGDPQVPLERLLQQAAYTLDDARLCKPQATDDCVAR